MHDIVAEQTLIGLVLIRNEVFPAISETVAAEHFFEEAHQSIWEIIKSLIGMGKLASPITVKEFLPADLKIGELSVQVYMARLAAAACTVSEAPHMAAMVRDLADRRAIVGVAEQLATSKPMDPADLASWGIDELDRIVSQRSMGSVPSLTLGASIVRTVDVAARAYQNDGTISGMSFGLRDLDIKTSGLQKGELTILAGRPGMMKTGLVLNIAKSLCQAGRKGMFFALEMGDVSITRRMLCDLIFDRHELPYFRIKSGNFTEKDFEHFRDAAMIAKDLPLKIEQQTGVTLSQIGAKARQMKRKSGLDFMVVDHMGHVQASDRYAGSKVNEMGEISTGLLRLSRELDIGVIALCQLNRGVESREDKRPNLSDLRASGNIEEDAATVIMVYREAYYLANREPKVGTPEYEKWQLDMVGCYDKLQILIEKQREGPSGAVQAFVNPACNAVRDDGWNRIAASWAADERERFVF